MAAAVTAALSGVGQQAKGAVATLTWDPNLNRSGGGGIWSTTSGSAIWYNGSVDVVWPVTTGTSNPQDIAVFGSATQTLDSSGGANLQVVVNADDKGVAGLTFNTLAGMQQISQNLSGSWAANSNVITLSNVNNIRPGEAISAVAGVPAGSVILAVDTVSMQVTISKLTTLAGTNAALNTTSGYILAGGKNLAPVLSSTTITLGANTDTILDDGFTNYPHYQSSNSTQGVYLTDSTFGGALGDLTGVGNIQFAGSGTLTFPGFQGLNATMGTGFTGTVIFSGGGVPANNSSTSFVPNLAILSGTAVFAKTGTGSAMGTNSIILINGPTAKLQLAAVTGNAAGQIGDNSTLTLSSGELDLNTNSNEVIGVLTDNGIPGGIIDNTAPGTNSTLTMSGVGASTFGGLIQSTGGVLGIGKTGTGSLTLTNANTFTGPLNITGGRVVLSGSGSAASAVTQIVNGLLIIDDGANGNTDITRLGSVRISSNSAAAGSDGILVSTSTNTIDRVGDITINGQPSALGQATGVANINLPDNGSIFTFQANSINRDSNGVGVFTLYDGFDGFELGFDVSFKVNHAPTMIGGIVPWGYIPNTGFLTYDNALGFIPAQTNASGELEDNQPGPGQDFSGNVGSPNLTTTTYNSIFNGGNGTVTIGNNLTVTSGAIADASGSLIFSGGTLTLPFGATIYGGGGALVNFDTDINSSGNVQLIQADGSPNANFVFSAPSPDFTGTLFVGGVAGGPTLTLANVDALRFATIDTSLNGHITIAYNGGTVTGPSTTYNIGGIQGSSGTITVSANVATQGVYTLAIGYNNTSTTFSGSIQEGGGGGLSAVVPIHKVGSGTLTFTGNVDNNGSSWIVDDGDLVLARNSNANVHNGNSFTINTGGTLTLGGTGGDQIWDNAGASGATDTLTLSGGVFDLNGRSETINTLNGSSSGSGVIVNNGTAQSILTVARTGIAMNVGASIVDGTAPLGLSINGGSATTLTLNATNNFSGPTLLGPGVTLIANGATTVGNLSLGGTTSALLATLVANDVLTVGGSLSYTGNVTTQTFGGTGTLVLGGAFYGALSGTSSSASQTLTWAGPGSLAINSPNTPFAGNLVLSGGNLIMNGGSAPSVTSTVINGVNNGIILSNATGGTLNRLNNGIVLKGGSPFITASGGSTATVDNVGTVTMGGTGLFGVYSNGAPETLDISQLNLLPGGVFKVDTNDVLGVGTKLIIGNGTTFNVGGIIPGALASSGSHFLGLVTYNATNGIQVAGSNATQILNGQVRPNDIFSGDLNSPFDTGASNTSPTTTGAIINTVDGATLHLGNTLTLASGAIASTPNLTISDSGSGLGVLAFGSTKGAIYPAGGGTVTINVPMSGTNGLALVSGSSIGSDFVLNSASHVGGYTAVGAGDTLTLANPLALADSALNLPGPTGALVFSGSNAYTLGGLGGGLSVDLTNTAAAPVTLYVGTGSVNTTYAGNLSGGGSLVKIGNTVMNLDYFGGANNGTYAGTTISGGTLALNDIPTSTNNLTINTFGTGAITINTGGTLDFNNTLTTNAIYVPNNIVLAGGTIREESNNVHLGSDSANATAATLSTISVAANSNGNLITTADTMDIQLDGFLDLPSSSTLTIGSSGNVTQGAVWFNNSASSVNGTIVINGTSNRGGHIIVNSVGELANASLIVAGGSNNSSWFLVNASVGSISGTGVMALTSFSNAAENVYEGNLGSTTWGGNFTGGGTLTKVGANTTLTITGSNSLNGAISVAGGNLVLSGSGSAATGNIIVGVGGHAVFDASSSTDSLITRAGAMKLGQYGSQPALTVLGNTGTANTASGINGALTAASGISTINLVPGGTGTLSLSAGSLVHNVGALNVATTGTLGTNALFTVSGFTGTTVSALNAPVIPFVIVNNMGFASYDAVKGVALAGSESTLGDGETALNNFNGSAAGVTLNSATSINSLFNTSPGTFTVNNLLNIGSGGLATTTDLNIGGTGSLTATGTPLGATASASNEMIIIDNGHNVSINVPIAAGPAGSFTANALSVVGTPGSTVTLNAANTFTGVTNISGAVLVLANNDALQFSTFKNDPANNGTLSFGTLTAPVLGGISGPAGTAMTIPSGVNLGVGGNNQTTTFGGTINGAGSFTKVGSGTITFDQGGNVSTGLTSLQYSGNTTVSGGMMQITGLAVGDATVNQYWVAGGATSTLTLSNGGKYLTVVPATSGSQGYLPNVVFDGGQYENIDGIAHIGKDANGNLHNVYVTANGGTITSTWNNKTVLVDGILTNSGTGSGTLYVSSLATGGFAPNVSGVEFTNSDNPFAGIVQTTTNNVIQLAIGNPGTVGNSLDHAIISLSQNFPAFNTNRFGTFFGGNGIATFDAQGNPTGSTGGSNSLVFNGTAYTDAVIGGLEGVGKFALTNTASVNNAINLTIATLSSNNATGSYTGVMSGAGSLTIGGTGTVSLGGANTYAGNTTLAGGVLALASHNAITGTGGGIVFSGGTLQLTPGVVADDLTSRFSTNGAPAYVDTNGQAATWSTIPAAVGDFTKVGTGTLTLTTISASGTTTIAKGDLSATTINSNLEIGLGGNLLPNATVAALTANGTVHVSTGGVINLVDNAIDSVTFSNAVTMESGSVIDFELGPDNQVDTINMGSSFTQNGVVTLNFGLEIGSTPSNTATYTLISGSSPITAANFVTGVVPQGFSMTLSSSGNALVANSAYVAPAVAFWTGASNTDWNTSANWASDQAGTATNFAPGILSDVTFSANTAGAGDLTTSLGTLTQVSSITFQGSQNVTIGGTSDLYLEALSGTGLKLLNGAGSATINTTGNVELGSSQIWENDSSTALLTVSSGITGAGSLTLGSASGIGTIVLNGSGTYSGGTDIINGVVQTGNLGALGTGPLQMNGGTLDIHGTTVSAGKLSGTAGVITNLGATAAALTINTGSSSSSSTFAGNIVDGTSATALNVQGNGTLVLTGSVSATGNFTQGASVLQIGDGTTFGTFSANDAVTGGTLSFNPGASGNVSYSGALTGTGGLLLANGHLTVLNVSNTYSGGNTVSAGTLTAGGNNALGLNGNLNLSATAVLDLNGFSVNAGQVLGAGGLITNLGTGVGNLTISPPQNTNDTTTAIIQDGVNGKVGISIYSPGSTANGTVTLSTYNNAGESNFSGGITVNAGLLSFGTSLPLNAVDQLTGGTVTLNGGFIFETNLQGFDSGQYFIPDIVFAGGGGVIAQEGTLHLGQDSSNNLSTIPVAGNTTLEATYNNKNLAVDGKLVGSGTLTVALHNNGAFDSGVDFTNPDNTFNGTVLVNTGTNSQGAVAAIANTGTMGTALQFATINLNGNLNGTVGNPLSLPVISWNPVLPQPGNYGFDASDPRFQSNLYFNSTQMTAAIIAGLVGNGNFALMNTVTDPASAALALTVNQTAGVDSYTGVMSGTGSLIKTGSGTLGLGGANTYSGPTTVSGGQILLQNSSALEMTVVTVTSPASLGFDKASQGGQPGLFLIGQLTGNANIALVDNATPTPAGVELRIGVNNANSTYSGAFSGAGSLTQAGTGNLLLTGANNLTGALNVAAGSVEIGGGNTQTVGAVGLTGNLQIDSGTTLHSNGVNGAGNWTINGSQQIIAGNNSAGASKVGSVTLGGSGHLDITNNLLVFEPTAGNKAAELSSVLNSVASGGIASTTLALTPGTAIAVVDNGATPTPKSSLRGESLDSNSIVVVQALQGDTDLSGTVNFGDFTALLQAYTAPAASRGWAQGDSTGNGAFADLTALLQNYNKTFGDFSVSPAGGSSLSLAPAGNTGGSSSPVPEPASLAVLALGGAALLARRRRNY